jgi:hypothetical protein
MAFFGRRRVGAWSLVLCGVFGCSSGSVPVTPATGIAGSGGVDGGASGASAGARTEAGAGGAGGSTLDGPLGGSGGGGTDGGAAGSTGAEAGLAAITFDVPLKMYTFDSQTWTPPSSTLVVSVVQKMDLKAEVPALSASKALMDAALSHLRFSVVGTLNVDLPAIGLSLAPDGVIDPLDPRAKKIGTVPAIVAGGSSSGDIAKEPDADQTFAAYAHALGTPFEVIASTTISLAAGSPTPTGSVTISVTGTVSAKL